MRRSLGFLSAPALALLGCFGAPSTEALLARADVLRFEGRYPEAARAYEEVLTSLKTTDPLPAAVDLELAALKNLAETRHLYLADVGGAVRAYRALIERSPSPPEVLAARLAIARLLKERLDDRDGALSELDAIAASPSVAAVSPRVARDLAQLSFSLGQYALVLRYAAIAAEDPELYGPARLLVASVHEVEGRPDQALAAYGEVIAAGPDVEMLSRAHYEVGRILEARGETAQALEHYRAARLGASSPALVEARLSRLQAKLALSSIRP